VNPSSTVRVELSVGKAATDPRGGGRREEEGGERRRGVRAELFITVSQQ